MKLLLLATLLTFLIACKAQSPNVTDVLNELLMRHDKRVRPNWNGPPVDVGVTMYFIAMYDISTKDQQLRTDFYLRHMWKDPRLAFQNVSGIDFITLGGTSANRIWEPDTFFPEGHAKFAHDGNVFYRIGRDGSVLKSVRIFATARSIMDLTYFPFDMQAFSLSFESYGYSAKDIVYRWASGKESVGYSEGDSGSHEMTIKGFKLKTDMIHLTSGNYSRLNVDFFMSRKSGYYCRHFYLPAIIAFIFTWATFWFSTSQAVVRVLLIICSIMIGNYLLAQTLDYIPQVSQATMLEKYIIFGLMMSALALLECATVLFVERKGRQSNVYQSDVETNLLDGAGKKSPKNQESDVEESKSNAGSYIRRSAKYIMTIHKHRRSHKKIDIFFRFLYTIIYVIYNIWYWLAFP